ncbi:hypothetical protein MalM25_04910 [Planctomycetes bacterium MalM25]|nr:hypothetical protein MalM25_04910 [Planctomycetes bacterium MalM25]
MSAKPLSLRRAGLPACLVLACLIGASPSLAADSADASLPKPKVSITLSGGLIHDVFGVTNAALTGVAEALQEHQGGGEAVKMTAEQIRSVKQVLGLATDSITGVRLRVYEKLEPAAYQSLVAAHNSQLTDEGWEQVVEVNDQREQVRIALRNDEGAVRGVRILAGGGNETVSIDADCDLSPERVQELTRTATKIAFDFGLEDALEEVVEEVSRELKRKAH